MWTKQLPTKPGWYWWRRYRYKAVSMYYVHSDYPNTVAEYARECNGYLVDKERLVDIGGEWWGPIQLTEDQQLLPCGDNND